MPEGIRLSKCDSLPAVHVSQTTYPSPIPRDRPAGERVALVESMNQRKRHEGRYYFPSFTYIEAYDLRESTQTSHPSVWAGVNLLKRVLANRPTASTLHSEKYNCNRDACPPANAAQGFLSHLHYIDAPWGSGYLVLTQHSQDSGTRINNDELFCLFQGITKDKALLLCGSFSVTHHVLPDKFDTAPPGTLEEDIKRLDRLDDDSFSPSLKDLQKMVSLIQTK